MFRIEEAIAEGNDTLETTGGNIEDELLAEVEEPEPEQSEETDELVKIYIFTRISKLTSWFGVIIDSFLCYFV